MKHTFVIQLQGVLALHPFAEKKVTLDTEKEFGDEFQEMTKEEQDKEIHQWLADIKEQFLWNSVDIVVREV